MGVGERPDLPAIRLTFQRTGDAIEYIEATPAPDVPLAREIARPAAGQVEGSWCEVHRPGVDEPLYTFGAIDPASVLVESFTEDGIQVTLGDAPVTFDLYVPNLQEPIEFRIYSSEFAEAFQLPPEEPAAKIEIDLGRLP
jgi:hypothetical protein